VIVNQVIPISDVAIMPNNALDILLEETLVEVYLLGFVMMWCSMHLCSFFSAGDLYGQHIS